MDAIPDRQVIIKLTFNDLESLRLKFGSEINQFSFSCGHLRAHILVVASKGNWLSCHGKFLTHTLYILFNAAFNCLLHIFYLSSPIDLG